MNISDLSYLEVVAEASSVVGGSKKKSTSSPLTIKVPVFTFPFSTTQQTNVATITQVATATSAAVSKKGDATSVANAENNLDFAQANVAGSN